MKSFLFIAFIGMASYFTQCEAVTCYLCQNATGNCNTGQCTGSVCYKTQAYYNAAGRQQEYVQKGCAATGQKGCTSVNLFSYSNAQQCICDGDLCNGVSANFVPSFVSTVLMAVFTTFVIKNFKLF